MKKLDYCLHSHTTRCGHAKGTDEEYVISAIQNGFKTMGYSDHGFFEGIHSPGMRGDFELLDEYKSSVYSLREKYKNKIDIFLGFEIEYCSFRKAYYKWLLKNGFDYLIIGQHATFASNDISSYTAFNFKSDSEINGLKRYVNDIVAAMRSKLFLYIAHPDFFVMGLNGWDKRAEKYARKICAASVKYDVPLEINLGGVRNKIIRNAINMYPHDSFWKIVGEYGCKVVVGVDAHDPLNYQTTYEEYAYNLIKKYKLNYISNIADLIGK